MPRRVCSARTPRRAVATNNAPPAGALKQPVIRKNRNTSPIPTIVRSGRHAQYWNARGAQHLLRRRAEKNLLDPALMPAANSHHDQAEMEIRRDAQNLRERLADHYH